MYVRFIVQSFLPVFRINVLLTKESVNEFYVCTE